ncbi:MAG: recN [Gammaproteobacteria bacterium]|nr:recN [Gammaproteobacteria bacterium]
MLTHIHITNFTIIDKLDLSLNAGMTVLTGETGAGKSIIIDALGLILGGRTDSSLVRHGTERCDITVTFSLANDAIAKQWLRKHELDNEDECIVRRTISQNGKSRVYINGQPVTLQQLKDLGNRLISIHGQHEHQTLQKKDRQRQLLDAFAGLQPQLAQVKQLHQQWHAKRQQLDELISKTKQRKLQQEYLQFQVQELAELNLQANELAELQQEHQLLANVDKILQSSQQALASLSETEQHNAIDLLQQVHATIEGLSETDARLTAVAELLNSAVIQAEEASAELRDYLKHIEADPTRLNAIEERLSAIYELARKHKVHPEQLFEHGVQLNSELQQLSQLDDNLQELAQLIKKFEAEYLAAAKDLTVKRQVAASQLSQLITEQMQRLAMTGGRFAIELQPRDEYHATGLENVEFLVSANPGYPLQSLSKVASGGELSRISLAIQVIAAQYNPIPSLIFDEVDVGIGGGTAEVVGRLLRTIGANRQVLCVTHLPQVASQGHHHLQVEKQVSQQTTITRIQMLDAEGRVIEVARMLGGVHVTEQTLAHAKEMLSQV